MTPRTVRFGFGWSGAGFDGVGGELLVMRRRGLNERMTAVVIPVHIRLVAKRPSGTRTRPAFNRVVISRRVDA
jgi:hypothetical protein